MTGIVDFQNISSKTELLDFLERNRESNPEYDAALEKYYYEEELKLLQGELVNLQNWIQCTGKKVAIIAGIHPAKYSLPGEKRRGASAGKY